MLSVAKISSAAAGASYYQKDNYYASDDKNSQGTWRGKASKELGLEGKFVKIEDFERYLEGHMSGNQSIFRMNGGEKQHTPGWDMTYSAPKSVSFGIEVLGDKKLSRLHDKAVNSTLNIFEKEYLVTRIYDKQTKTQIPMGDQKMLVALFKHDLSRNEDPHTHTHCPLINAVLDNKGKWRALDSRASIYDNKMLLGMIYRADMAHKVKQAGHEILVYGKSDGQAYFDLKGIDRKITKEFSSRSDDIKHHLGEGAHSAADKANAALRTRQGKRVSVRGQLRDKWEGQLKALGFTLSGIQKNIEKHSIAGMRKIPNHMSPTNILNRATAHLHNKKAAFETRDIYLAMLQDGLGYIRYPQVKAVVTRALKNGYLIEKNDGLLTTSKQQEHERIVLGLEKFGRATTNPIMKASSVEATLGDHTLTTGQQGAAKLILTSPNSVIGVQGLAGTGKSFMLKSVTRQATAKGYKIIAIAPSSTVTSDLRENLGVEAKTLTSFLLRPSGSKNTIVLLDESSMVSTKQMSDLLKITAERQLAKVVLIGDVNQLSSPDAGNPFDRLQNNEMRTAHMTDIVRQDSDRHRSAVRFSSMGEFRNAFAKLGADIREITNGELAKAAGDEWLASDERAKTGVVVNTNNTVDDVNSYIKSALQSEGKVSKEGVQIETYRTINLQTPKNRYANNYYDADAIRFHRNYKRLGVKAGDIYKVDNIDFERGILNLVSGSRTIEFKPARDALGENAIQVLETRKTALNAGDEIRFTSNDRNLGIENTDRATIKSISEDGVEIHLHKGEELTLDIEDKQLKFLNHAWAQTNHAFQGKTLKHCIAIFSASEQMTDRQSFYTGISRGKQSITVLTDDKQFLQATLEKRTGSRPSALDVPEKVKQEKRETLDKQKVIQPEQRTRERVPDRGFSR